jgi:hypothetical protein
MPAPSSATSSRSIRPSGTHVRLAFELEVYVQVRASSPVIMDTIRSFFVTRLDYSVRISRSLSLTIVSRARVPRVSPSVLALEQ